LGHFPFLGFDIQINALAMGKRAYYNLLSRAIRLVINRLDFPEAN
jgi:hypothetical protein